MGEERPGRLTPKQLLFLERLVQYQAREGVPPSVREMQALGGFRSPRSVAQFLDALQQAGYIDRAAGARNVRVLRRSTGAALTDRTDTVSVPVIGQVAAGQPILAAENVESYIPVSTSLARGRWSYFILRVRGDSMDRAGIQDGDLVLVRQQDTAEPGEHVVALIDDSATVKRLRVGRDAILLEPLSTNPVHRPIVVGPDFRVQGVVVATIPSQE
ncbi:MAG: transcriptional repressor LexA [Thermoanaerobaculia bacterium]